jgi:hypothetical protein
MESKNSNLAAISSPGEKTPSTEVTPAEKALLASPAAPETGAVGAETGRKISREFLVNRINFVNFQEDHIQIHFTHREYNRSLFIPAFPQPCFGPVLECLWREETDMAHLIQTHELKYILVPRGQKFIQTFPEIIEINSKGCRLGLPNISREICHRRVERQRCRDISVHLIQNSSSFSGALLDFAASSFRVELTAEPPQSFEWIDPAQPAQVLFHADNQTLYSGECRIIRSTQGRCTRSYVLEPLKDQIHRYGKAEFRSRRQTVSPSPNIIFRHPLTQKRLDLKVADLSGSGFAVEEEEHSSCLLPGLILPEVELHFAGIFKLTCSTQVVFRKPFADRGETGRVRCGLALIDVTAQDHIKLLGMLHQAKDKNSYLCTNLDLDALWDFLFETGFIYPSKYALIIKHKQEIRQTYDKLYTRSPSIARHFVYQDNGTIMGHMAMIRFWKNSWLTHHHAARKSALNRAGLLVLDQIGRFVYDTYRLSNMHMDYLVCYYRPQNRFPNRVFGGVARHINNPKGCSVDPMAYLKLPNSGPKVPSFPTGWELVPSISDDLVELGYFYEETSGGLMLKALDLEAHSFRDDAICNEFQRHGFRRERRLFSLREKGQLRALLIAYISDIGLNLSDLTNCVKAVVLDPKQLPPEVLFDALRLSCLTTGQKDAPALIYPFIYAETNSIPFEKTYNLWIVHMHSQIQAYFKYLNRLLRYVQLPYCGGDFPPGVRDTAGGAGIAAGKPLTARKPIAE